MMEAGALIRSTDATVFAPIEGHDRSVISTRGAEDFVVEWGKPDLFLVPSWHRVRHEAAEDSALFSFSDRPSRKPCTCSERTVAISETVLQFETTHTGRVLVPLPVTSGAVAGTVHRFLCAASSASATTI